MESDWIWRARPCSRPGIRCLRAGGAETLPAGLKVAATLPVAPACELTSRPARNGKTQTGWRAEPHPTDYCIVAGAAFDMVKDSWPGSDNKLR